MKLSPFAACILLGIGLASAVAEEAKSGMNAMQGMGGMSGTGMQGMGSTNGMGMPGMGGHMHHPVESMQGSGSGDAAATPKDERHVITLTAEERDFVLAEMRNFLDSVQGIVDAVASGRPSDAANAARRSGMHVMRKAPQSMMGKMPMEFRKLGMDTHQRFAAIAEEATAMADDKKILKQLADMLANCGACHQGYRIEVK